MKPGKSLNLFSGRNGPILILGSCFIFLIVIELYRIQESINNSDKNFIQLDFDFLHNTRDLIHLPSKEEKECPLSDEIIKKQYSPIEVRLFPDQLYEDTSKCILSELTTKDLALAEGKQLDWSLKEYLIKLNSSRPLYWETFFNRVPQELEDSSFDKYWFKFGGSSVWLSDLNVHLLTSRLSYCPSGNRNEPLVSFVLAQIYDKDWNEIKGILKLPKMKVTDNLAIATSFEFPDIFPIEFWYHQTDQKGVSFGPEEPKIFLANNGFGYEEPVVTFNMPVRHDNASNAGDQYNVMHGYFPYKKRLLQFVHPDGHLPNLRQNWTPIVLGDNEPYSNKIHFVYRIEDLTVVECHIFSGVCSYRYKLNPLIDPVTDGDLKGGTPFIPLLAHESYQLPRGKKIWLSFAKANIANCGCTSDFCRPNLVILEEIGGTLFKISYVSAYVDLNAQILGGNRLIEHCAASNVLSPNGIAYWRRKGGEDKNGEIEDYLGLVISVSDGFDQLVHIKGILKYVLSLPGLLDSPNSESIKTSKGNIVCALEDSQYICDDEKP